MKTVLVTGATAGIGMQTARVLAREGLSVLVHGPEELQATKMAEEISRLGDARPVWGDFTRLDEVRQLADQVRAQTGVLDVLINNAGVFMRTFAETPDGHETMFQVNHLAPFLLTLLLTNEICASSQGRVITVASAMHFRGHIYFDDLENRRAFDPHDAYSDTKLANVLFAYELAERLKCDGATSNAVHPGSVDTRLLHEAFPDARGVSLAEGARTPVYLATSPDVSLVTGAYFADCHVAHASPKTHDQELRTHLWGLSAEMVGV